MKPAFFALVVLLAGCDSESAVEPTVLLGRRRLHGYHLLANGATTIPDGESGFLATADGHGLYHLDWIAAPGAKPHVSGSITTDNGFDPNGTVELTGAEAVQFETTTQILFSGKPGDALQGLSFAVVKPADAVYLDLSLDGTRNGTLLFFTGAVTGLVQQSAYDPVAFTSP